MTSPHQPVGPVNATRVPRYAGPATFARLPRIDEVPHADIAVVGVPFDSGVSYRPGARFGPGHIRASSKLLRPYHPRLDVEPFAVQQVADAGDVAVNPFDIAEAIATIEQASDELRDGGTKLITLGGDHTIALPLLRSLHRDHGPISVLHFDAHLDTWDTYFGAPFTHGTPFRRASEEGLLDPEHCLHVGIRGPLYASTDLSDDRVLGFQVLGSDDFQLDGLAAVIERMRARLGDAPVYVSIDIDVLDPAHAPGTGTPEAGGMTSRELLHCLRNLVGVNVIGADIVEVAPAYDHAEITGIAAAHGVNAIFGIPGTHNLELYRHFGKAGIRAITPRHEQGAGYAAEAYARVSGRPGVVVTTSGPALTNAFGTFTGRRPRPVHIEIPIDVLEQTWSGEPRVCTSVAAPHADPGHVRRAAALLAAATQPMIIAGGGAVDAQAEVTALAEALGAPVATTVNGKGVVDESHPLSVGASIRLRALQRAAAESDALLVVGTELGDSDLWEGQIRGRTVIRCDIDPAQLDKNCPADLALQGDAATTVAALLAALPADRVTTATGSARAAPLRAACRDEASNDAGAYAEINAAVRAALPPDAVLAGDSSQVTYFGSVHFFDVPAPRRFCYTPGFATLGYGLPAGLGASIARPGAPVAVLLGDGALMFSVQELVALVEQRLSVPVIVVDNGGYQEIRDQQAARNIPPIGVELRTPDLAALAIAMGAHGVRTTSSADLPELIAGALDADGPTLIHLDIR